jgi:hypothetical protein
VMHGHEFEKGEKGHHMGIWAMEMMLWKHLTEEQQRELLLRELDLKIKMKEMKIAAMRDKISLLEEKLDMMRSIKGMIKG